jgi:hypothetical protein
MSDARVTMSTLRVEQGSRRAKEEDVAKSLVFLDVPAVPYPMVLEAKHGSKLAAESV